MHVSSHSATKSIGVTEKFKQQKGRVDAAHDQRGSPPMVKGQCVSITNLSDNSCRNGFFPYGQMHFTRNFPVFPELHDGLFEQAAFEHQSVEIKKIGLQMFLLLSAAGILD
jgi:hypothetical protein